MFQRFSFKPEAHLEYIFGRPPDGNLDIYGWMNSGLNGTAPDILYCAKLWTGGFVEGVCICDLHLWSCYAAVVLLLYFVLRHLLAGELGATALVQVTFGCAKVLVVLQRRSPCLGSLLRKGQTVLYDRQIEWFTGNTWSLECSDFFCLCPCRIWVCAGVAYTSFPVWREDG